MKLIKIALGAIVGAAAGFAAGVLFAPRSGAESRAMASDAMNDAWDSAIDTYERGQQVVSEKIKGVRPNVDATTDELRAKVDLARERMDQLRDSLVNAGDVESEDEDAVAETIEVEVVSEEVAEDVDDAADDAEAEAEENKTEE